MTKFSKNFWNATTQPQISSLEQLETPSCYP